MPQSGLEDSAHFLAESLCNEPLLYLSLNNNNNTLRGYGAAAIGAVRAEGAGQGDRAGRTILNRR